LSCKTTLRAILENFIDNKSSPTVSSYESAVIPLLEWFCTPKGELAYNLKMQNKMNATKTTLVEVMEFHGTNIAFEEINGKMMINATQMAKPFGKEKSPYNWLRTQQAKELVNAVSVSHICGTDDLQVVRQGGTNQGTFFQEDVALFFAQWLSPEFYLACNKKLKELLTKQVLHLEPKYGVYPIIDEGVLIYPYTDCLKTLGASLKSSASKRKAKFPQHFKIKFGRNFITSHYFDLLHSYYSYKLASNQLSLPL
jgi:hypothetical protein